MWFAIVIGLLAFALALWVVISAATKDRRDEMMISSWSDIKGAFAAHPLRDVREDAARLAEPLDRGRDLGVGDLLDLSEDGTGYVDPRDLLALRGGRN